MRGMQWVVFLLVLVFPVVTTQAQRLEEPVLVSRIGRGTIDSVQWHPDSAYIMVTTITGTWLYTPDLKDLAYIPAYFAQMSPDGRYIAGLDENRQVRLWDAKTFDLLERHDSDTFQDLMSLIWSPDSRVLIMIGHARNQEMSFVWYVESGNDLESWTYAFPDVFWNADGRYLAIPSGGYLHIFKSGTSYLELVMNYEHDLSPYDTFWTGWEDKTHFVLTGANPNQNLWFDVLTKEVELRSYAVPLRSRQNPAGTLEISWGGDRDFAVHNIENPSLYVSLSNGADFMIPSWDHQGLFLAVGEFSGFSTPTEVRIIDLQTYQVIQHLGGFLGSIKSLLWSPDDRFLLMTDAKQQIVVYETRTWQVYSYSSEHTSVGEVITWNPQDVTQFALADTLGGLALWDVRASQQEWTFLYKDVPIRQIKWQPEGSLIATLAYDLYSSLFVRLLDSQSAANQNLIKNIQVASSPSAFDWSATGDRLALLGDETLSLWDQTTNTVQQIPVSYISRPMDLAWSPDEQVITLVMDNSDSQSSFYVLPTQSHLWGAGNQAVGAGIWTEDNTWLSLMWGGQHQENYVQPVLKRFVAPFDPTRPWSDSQVMNATPVSSNPLVGLITNTKEGFLSPHGRYAAAVDEENNGMIWDAATAKSLSMLTNTSNIVWSPDETLAMIQRMDGTLWLLTGEGQLIAQIPTLVSTQEPSGTFFWSPDSAQVAYLHDGLVETWQVR